MTDTTSTLTCLYGTRLPHHSTIRGVLALRDPSKFDLSTLPSPGVPLDSDKFVLPDASHGSQDPIVVRRTVRASETRAYVEIDNDPWSGWWRVDTWLPQAPHPSEVVGELTPVTFASVSTTIEANDLRVDDILYASGLPGRRLSARVLDVVFEQDDGCGILVLIRTSYGWYRWRRSFVHVAAF